MKLKATVLAAASAFALAGCMSPPPILDKFADGPPSLFKKKNSDAEVARNATDATDIPGKGHSEIIDTLIARRSMLPSVSPFDQIASAALAASARSSEAELRQAKLRAEAKSKNWLPTLGPSVSLTSLGDLVAGILLEQILFDGGRRKAEREFAAADVEVAAVNLAIDMNTRVEIALGLYLSAMRGQEKAALSRRALSRMHEFERIVIGRVEGGVSNRADQRVAEARVNDLNAAISTAEEARGAAISELYAMTGREFDTTPRALSMSEPANHPTALSILKAEAEGNRTLAEAKMERAGFMPQISAQGNVASGGTTGSINAGTTQPIGFGTGAALKALKGTEEIVDRQLAEADEGARRSYARHASRLASYQRQATQAENLATEARETFRLFQAQFKAGQRSVMEVINVYERLVQREQAHVDAKYEVVLIQLEMARDLGLLADGEDI